MDTSDYNLLYIRIEWVRHYNLRLTEHNKADLIYKHVPNKPVAYRHRR